MGTSGRYNIAFNRRGADQVNKTSTTEPNFDQQASTPSVHVDDNATVVVTYCDVRNNTPDTASLDTDYFAVSCGSASEKCANPASWEEERVTPQSFHIRNAPLARGYFLGDYMGLANVGNDFVSAFGSTVGGGPSSIFFSRLSPP